MSLTSRMAYCIDCEGMYPVEYAMCGDECHPYLAGYDDFDHPEWDYCYFPLGQLSEPPYYPENWDELVECPSDEELKLMDEAAEELLLNLNGE